MSFPAKLSNLEELHFFLSNGFNTFKNTKNPELFVKTLIERERKIMFELFN
jgi:hypothetical protein